MRRQIIITIIVMFIAIIGCIIHGQKVLSTTWGEKNPDVLINANDNMTIQIEEAEYNVFADDSIQKYSDLYDVSSIIIAGRVSNKRIMSLQSTDTHITVEKIYKDDTNNLSENSDIILVEPFSIHLENTYHSAGYQMLKKNEEYILFLNPLKCVEGYTYDKKERISFIPSTQYFSRFCISNTEETELLNKNNEELYHSFYSNAFLSDDKNVKVLYSLLYNDVLNKFSKNE